MQRKRGQSILEYVIVLTIVVAAIVVGAKDYIAEAVKQALDDSATAITTATDKLLESLE